MQHGYSVAAIIPAFNEEGKLGDVIRRIPRPLIDEIIVVDDGSTDRSVQIAQEYGTTVLSMGRSSGVGAALRNGYAYAVNAGYDIAIVVAGNNKDAPEEMPLLLEPLVTGRADFVQGSRFLNRHVNFGPMPLYRRLATRLHPLLFSLVARRWVTESTNGFRAIHRRVLEDPRLALDLSWLDHYELEPYLYLQAIRFGYTTVEVPVTKIYPPRSLGQTKMRPIIDWWSILRPLVYVGMRSKAVPASLGRRNRAE